MCVSECAERCSYSWAERRIWLLAAVLTFQDWQQHSWCECVWECVCVRVCVQERESPLHSTLLSFSLPSLAPFLLPALWLLSPSLLYTFFLSSLLYVPLPPSLPVLRLYPLLSLSLAVHHFWRWMSQRLKLRRLCPWLAAIHKLVIKRNGREEEQGRKAEGG